jgi:hypothetical protein
MDELVVGDEVEVVDAGPEMDRFEIFHHGKDQDGFMDPVRVGH